MNDDHRPTTAWQERLPGGNHWSGRLRRGTTLMLTAVAPRANVSALFFNAEQSLERYSMPDTLKAQHTAFLTVGHALHSDMGRILCSIVDDSVGWHDTWCGLSNAATIRTRHGEKRYQEYRNAMHRSGRDGMLIELAKHGLGPRDLVPNVNFFSKVVIDDENDGTLRFVEGHAPAGSQVTLRFEMDTLVVLSAAPHPLDHDADYSPAEVILAVGATSPAAADDRCRTACEQNTRAFVNTERHVGCWGTR